MKSWKALSGCMLFLLTGALCGCSPAQTLQSLTGGAREEAPLPTETPTPKPAAASSRVYMDEISGTLDAFYGDTVRVQTGDAAYDFDVSLASIECANGLLRGDEISVIYEGKMNSDDASTVKALKVADALHKKDVPAEQTLTGTLLSVGSWSLTMRTGEGQTLTLPIIGRPLYFSQGILTDLPITVHLIGSAQAEPDTYGLSGSSLVTVLSVSDAEPFAPPTEDPIQAIRKAHAEAGTREEDLDPVDTLQKLRVTVEAFSGNTIRVAAEHYDALLTLDVSALPIYFPEGILPGTMADLYFTGEFNEKDLTGLRLTELRGVPASRLQTADIRSRVTGTVLGSTADTLSLLTRDQTLFTCRMKNVPLRGASPLAGDSVSVLLSPAASFGTNVYSVMEIDVG